MKKEDLQNHLAKIKEDLGTELAQIRTGRASAAILDGIVVEAYPGTPPMPINELGTVSVPDAQSVLISPWDKSVLKKIEDAIRKSNRGINPVNEGEVLRIPVPPMTEEARKEKAKEVSKKVEDAKIKVRMIRQDVIKSVEEMEDNGVISEDDMHREKESIEKLIKEINTTLEEMGKKKEIELLQI